MEERYKTKEASPALDKRGLADRYMISIRTVEEWQAQGLIRCTGRKRKNHYDPMECDRLLMHTGNGKGCHGND